MKEHLKKIIGPRIWSFLRNVRSHFSSKGKQLSPVEQARKYFEYDLQRFVNYSGTFSNDSRGGQLAQIIMYYHIVEKGLTMPERRYSFGKDVIRTLMGKIKEFDKSWGIDDDQVRHGIGVVKEYLKIHAGRESDMLSDQQYWDEIKEFSQIYDSIPAATQIHCTRDEFYARSRGFNTFSAFAHARHTLRHYANKALPIERIREAVELAMSAPSACNRQYCRVHCVCDKEVIQKLLQIQGGNRGFGHLADKLLIVTVDLEGVNAVREHNDVYTNGGIFLMSLCYALFDKEIAHCILNWSREPNEDIATRQLIDIKNSESIVAVLTCGETPDEFDVAASPRKRLSDVLVIH